MKFLIWGAGFRGKRLLKILGNEYVIAFIDSVEQKIGKYIDNIPVIGFQEYVEKYKGYFIIISMLESDEVENYLRENDIYQYFLLAECPSEIKGYGNVGVNRLLEATIGENKRNLVLGSNLFSVLLCQELQKKNQQVICYPVESRCESTLDGLSSLLGITVMKDNVHMQEFDAVYVTVSDRTWMDNAPSTVKMINAYDFREKVIENYMPRMENFKNIHEGKRAFIVATGPSLKAEDLDCLKANQEICFSMNRIFCEDRSSWRPHYYVAADAKMIADYKEEILRYDTPYKILASSAATFLEEDNIYPMHIVEGCLSNGRYPFSENLEWGCYGAVTVTYTCIQLAVYMGIKEIYLLGVDCNYKNKNNYFKNELKDDVTNHHEDKMILSFLSAKKYADEHGIKIYNATRGGALEVFERVDFDSLF